MAAKPSIVLAVVVAATAVGERSAYSQQQRGHAQPPELSVTVRLDNNAGVPDQILTVAKARAAAIYKRIGVNLTWLDGRSAVPTHGPRFTVVLLSPHGERNKTLSEDTADAVVGQAVPAARRAYVFYERVLTLVSLPDRDIVTLLAYVMTHELGHLTLPPHSHSHTGIMRRDYDTDSRAIPSFTEVEAGAIRRRLGDDDRMWNVQAGRSDTAQLQP